MVYNYNVIKMQLNTKTTTVNQSIKYYKVNV